MLHEDTWYSTYRSEPKVVRVGTKPKPEPKPSRSRDADDRTRSTPARRDDVRRTPGSAADYASALATASTNQAGTRVGRCVDRVHGRVRRVAVGDELAARQRSTAYS